MILVILICCNVFTLIFLVKYRKAIMRRIIRYINSRRSAYIVMFGDSRIHCANWETLSMQNVVSCGIPGADTVALSAAVEKMIDKFNPAICIIQIGINDARTGIDPEQSALHLKKIIYALRSRSVVPVVTGIIPMRTDYTQDHPDTDMLNARVEDLNTRWMELAGKHYVNVHDEITEYGRLQVKFTNDGCHPNAIAYQLIINKLKAYLQQNI